MREHAQWVSSRVLALVGLTPGEGDWIVQWVEAQIAMDY